MQNLPEIAIKIWLEFLRPINDVSFSTIVLRISQTVEQKRGFEKPLELRLFIRMNLYVSMS